MLNNKHMKTLFITCLILCTMGMGRNATAQSTVETPSFMASISPVFNTNTVRVLVSKEYGKKFSLSVVDENQNPVYLNRMPKGATQHRFDLNLNELPNGKYYINLSDGKTPIVSKVIVKEPAVLAKPILSHQIICLN
jgi:hypothetical protein